LLQDKLGARAILLLKGDWLAARANQDTEAGRGRSP
jgi:hypothetical protein